MPFIILYVHKKGLILQENIKGILVKMMAKVGEWLDLQNLVFKGSFNQNTFDDKGYFSLLYFNQRHIRKG